METKIKKAVLTLFLCLFVSQASSAATGDVSKEKNPKTDQKIEKPSIPEKAEDKTKENKKYVYSPIGKLDPFISFLVQPGVAGRGATNLTGRDSRPQEENLIASEEPRTELEKIEISKLTLTAVVKGENKVWALVIDPKGRGYFLEKGTKIGTHSGVVDDILCVEKKTDFGVEIVRKVIVKIPYRDRNQKIIYRSVEMEMPYTKS